MNFEDKDITGVFWGNEAIEIGVTSRGTPSIQLTHREIEELYRKTASNGGEKLNIKALIKGAQQMNLVSEEEAVRLRDAKDRKNSMKYQRKHEARREIERRSELKELDLELEDVI